MSRVRLSAKKQRQVIERACRRYEYCQSPMDFASQSFASDHIISVSNGGLTEMNNLALACGGCNSHKYVKTEALGPLSQATVLLYHPRQQSWSEHFIWSVDFLEIVGLTAVGRATVKALKLNRPSVVNLLQLLVLAGLHPLRRS